MPPFFLLIMYFLSFLYDVNHDRFHVRLLSSLGNHHLFYGFPCDAHLVLYPLISRGNTDTYDRHAKEHIP